MQISRRWSPRSKGRTVSTGRALALGLALVGLVLPLGYGSASPALAAQGPQAPHPPSASLALTPTPAASRPPTWQNVTSALDSGPGGRSGAAAAFDIPDNEVVVFGGFGAAGEPLGGTWLYSNGTWSHPRTTGVPPARAGAAMAYDPVAKDVVMFGGHGVSGPLSDTWTFANDTWTNATGSVGTAPPKRFFAAFAWDTAVESAVLFGGRNYVTTLNDTWEFVNGSWQNVSAAAGSPNGSPSARFSASFAFDSTDQSLVLFGGNGTLAAGGKVLGDTWWFRAGHWSAQTPATPPSPRFGAAMVADASVGALVLFGGQSSSGGDVNDTWTYADGSWTGPIAPGAVVPSPRSDAAAVEYAGATSSESFLLLLGGAGATGQALNDTWIFGSETIVSVGVDGNRTGIDVGQSVEFVADPIGGVAPYTFAWSGDSAPLPSSCTSPAAPSIRCTVSTVGKFGVAVGVSESDGGLATTGTGSVEVAGRLTVVGLTVSPYPYRLGGGTVTVSAAVTGGTPPLTFAYSGLPSGCRTTNATNFTCTPSSTGNFVVTLTVTDSAGESNVSQATLVVDAPASASSWTLRDTALAGGIAFVVVVGAVVLLWRRRRPAVPVGTPTTPAESR